ncbi:NAD(P)/FAD-dependent oxidoreductase [uncultured Shewanella sp.]|uniref:NAD(P)/FAD-dependent oxidoreductase n=1 Tax=uncultured Shewanella sp. TaxID=173975 RepID=UPI0026399E44|nr:FAD-dependent oxidoreductase [uncultured Shewanella sp.]
MKKIAIIGSGISGLTCAYLLNKQCDVTVFEKNNYAGGHTATLDITHQDQTLAIDTGFIVFNDRTYPNFNQLLKRLNISRQATEMSFSVHHQHSGFEYNGHNINSLFAQRRNLFRPQFWRFLREIIKFNSDCKRAYSQHNIDPNLTLGQYLKQQGFSTFFSEHYILPMGAAIWSTSLETMQAFELKFFIQFFYHHGLLNILDRPQWYVIPGGSHSYVKAIQAQLKHPILLNCQINNVSRQSQGVTIEMHNGDKHHFDEVIFACHSDQALALLADPTPNETDILAATPYSRNDVVLHTDTRLLPQRQRAWASWNYKLDNDKARPACVTYNMNILQGLHSDTTFCVTLNQSEYIDPNKILRSFVYHHPILNNHSVKAQQKRPLINGQQHTYYVGAYWYSGFHEDGVKSALDVTQKLGVHL